MRFPNGVFYAPRGRDSSYFDFIPTFGLNWDCFRTDFKLRVMDMSEFDIILGMDWLMTHRVVIDCDRMRVTAYTLDRICVRFQGDKHEALPRAVYDSKWRGQLVGWLASLTLEDEVRQDLDLPQDICEYVDVFPNELLRLPSYRDVDFVIELHPGTSPILDVRMTFTLEEFCKLCI